MDLLTIALLVMAIILSALFLGGLSFSPVPGPFWHLPFLGDTLEFMDSPIKVKRSPRPTQCCHLDTSACTICTMDIAAQSVLA